MRITAAFIACLTIAGCAFAQSKPSNADIASRVLTADSSVDEILDALDVRGKDLHSFTADLTMATADTATGESNAHGGKFWFDAKSPYDTRLRVDFNTKQGKPTEDRIEYLLDQGKFIDREYKTHTQSTHQTLRPGEKLNLFKLGEGKFPLPIGQDKEDVHRQFDVKKINPDPKDPAGTVHLELTPKTDTSLARQFKVLHVWVDPTSHMPRRILTTDSNETTDSTVDLENVKLGVPLTDKDFTLEKIDESKWNLSEDVLPDGDKKK